MKCIHAKSMVALFWSGRNLYRWVEAPMITNFDWTLDPWFFILSNALHCPSTWSSSRKWWTSNDRWATMYSCTPQNSQVVQYFGSYLHNGETSPVMGMWTNAGPMYYCTSSMSGCQARHMLWRHNKKLHRQNGGSSSVMMYWDGTDQAAKTTNPPREKYSQKKSWLMVEKVPPFTLHGIHFYQDLCHWIRVKLATKTPSLLWMDHHSLFFTSTHL